MKLLIIHPGIQHSSRLANGAVMSGLFEKVTLLTSILFKPKQKLIGLLKKRVKPIDADVSIVNHYLYTLLFTVSRYLYNKIVVNPQNQSHNNPIYFWQQIFGILCLPRIYFQRKNTLVVCFETTGWPLVKYCKKWDIPVVMDFASISHEKAKTLGINETMYGIKLKVKERAFIDYAFYCSEFCRKSFEGLTSAKKDFVLYLGAEQWQTQETSSKNQDTYGVESFGENQDSRSKKQEICGVERKSMSIKLSFIANLEFRKGLDIFLESIYAYEYPVFLEVHLIGRIRESWVAEHMPKNIVNHQVKLIYQPAMSQGGLFDYLAKEQFDLNVQCSRFDSFAMVVPETMMQGIPNVVSPFVGAGEMIKNGVDGFIMKDLDSASLNNIFNQWMTLDLDERKSLVQRVLSSSKNMVWENYYGNLGMVFKEILADIK
ncbi:glycosyltransferase family 4 protein [Pedobacter arcticus]|uniref:glycosyltransferase family 4 protein n=1 Tax=Pedobacter arcticus TaxID=752140 RepID=UPI000314E73B|nr:glycosyltransferase [Pedobacter arcticus]